MKKITGWIVISVMVMIAAISCEVGATGNSESAGIKQDARMVQNQENVARGHRREGRFKNLSAEEKEQFLQKRRENGERMRQNFEERRNRYFERLRLENPGLNDEELQALLQERIAARREARQARIESGEGRPEGRQERRHFREGRPEGQERRHVREDRPEGQRERRHLREGRHEGQRKEWNGERPHGKRPKDNNSN